MNPRGTMELADFKARLWDMTDGREVGRLTTDGPTAVVALSPDGRLVATLSAVPAAGDGPIAATSAELSIWRLAGNLAIDRAATPGPSQDALAAMGYNGVLTLDGQRPAATKAHELRLRAATPRRRRFTRPRRGSAG